MKLISWLTIDGFFNLWDFKQRKRLSVAASSSDRSDTDSMDGAGASHPSTSLQGQADERSVVVKKLEPTPTARLDRTHDKVYDATTCVVRAVMLLSQGVQLAKSDNYVDLVKKVGLELRTLLTSVDQLVPQFPTSTHREVSQIHQLPLTVHNLKSTCRLRWPIKF